MNRRDILKLGAGAAAALASNRLGQMVQPVRADGRPNLVVIVTDDEDESQENSVVMPKTHQILLGNGGTAFNNFQYPTALCAPTRSTFFTGQFAHNHGVHNNQGAYQKFHNQWNEDLLTALQDVGYFGIYVGKYINGYSHGAIPGVDLNLAHKVTNSYNTGHGYLTIVQGEQAVQAINQAPKDKPLALFVEFHAPHSAAGHWPVPKDYKHVDVGPAVNKIEEARNRMVRVIDDEDAKIWAAYQAARGDEPVATIFASDNGYLFTKKIGKGTWLPGASKVPLWINYSGIASGTDNRLAATIDFCPTILDIAGATASWEMDGRSLLDNWDRTVMLLENFDESHGEIHGKHKANQPGFALVGSWGYYVEAKGQPPHFFAIDDQTTPIPLTSDQHDFWHGLLEEFKSAKGGKVREIDQTPIPDEMVPVAAHAATKQSDSSTKAGGNTKHAKHKNAA